MDVSIIIVNYRTPELTKNCIRSIEKVFDGAVYQYEVILVDNCSNDGRFSELKELESENVHVYETLKNGGFGYGNNYGVKRALGEFVFFLNSDTILYPSTIIEMICFMRENRDVGALTCYMEDGDKFPLVVSHAFESFKTLFVQTRIKPLIPKFLKRIRAERYQSRTEVEALDVDWVSGAGMLMPKSVFDEVGGWNEMFFMYMEDEELCYRVHKAGYRVALYPKMGIQHLIGQSGGSAFVAYEQFKSKILYFRLVYQKDSKSIRRLLFAQAKKYMKALPKEERNSVLKKLKEV